MSGSPIDMMPAADTLEARVVKPGDAPHLHGYDVDRDLAHFYAPHEVTLLALCGELPDAAATRRFAIASAFATAVSVREAPAHATVLARRYGSTPAALTSVAAIGLAEWARSEVTAELMEWTEGPPPEAAVGEPDPRVVRLAAVLDEAGVGVPALAEAPWSLSAALALTLRACGLGAAWQVEVALTHARLPTVMAEAMAHPRGDLGGYPIRQPPFAFDD